MNKITIIISAMIVALVVIITLALKNDDNKGQTEITNNEPSIIKKSDSKIDSQAGTIAKKWQWSQVKRQDQKNNIPLEQESGFPFTSKSVHDALSEVKIDENDNLVLDNDALISLDEALERIYNKLDNESSLALEDLIKEALPGKVGLQTAEVVSNYKDYLVAKEQFSILHENTGYNSSEQTVSTVQRDQSLYGELQALRELHLGQEVTENLFREHDANAEFMFDSIMLGLNDTLTPQQREQQRQEIESRLRQVIPLEAESLNVNEANLEE